MACAVTGCIAGIAACGGGSSSGGGGSSAGGGTQTSSSAASASAGGTLNMQFAGPPISLNPALNGNGGSSVYTSLDYDPLIYLSGGGKFVPDLATSWHYVGTGNKVFEMTLRKGVTFTDGSPLTAASVVASMKYFLKAGGSLVGDVGAIASITAPSKMTVRIAYKTADPDAVETMDQYNGIGWIIGPEGLKDPKTLMTKSDGTGPYEYDNAGSVENSSYAYTKNPHYFNPSAQRYDQVDVKVIGQPSAVLSAMQTGQISYAGGSASTYAAAQGAGLQTLKAPFFNWDVILPGTGNKAAPQLDNPKVRQAIAYALNRPAIANAISASLTVPSGEAILAGGNGYVKGAGYSYDLAKAKQLMAQAGQSKGFSLPVVTESLIDTNTTISQAIISGLSAIGIKAKLTVVSTGIGQFGAAAQSGKYGAVIFPSAGTDMYEVATQILSPGIFNPLHIPVPAAIQNTLDKAYETTGAAQTKLYQKANLLITREAEVVPVVATEDASYASKSLSNVAVSLLNPNPMPEAPTEALAWNGK